jgi:DNA-binding LacI/PurR family transcriptional regulator
MPSVREIARQVGVSPATVSRVINNRANVTPALRRKILGAVNRSRYIPRVGLRSTANIALVYTGESSLGCPFDAALLYGMTSPLEERGFDLAVLNLGRLRAAGDHDFSHLFMLKGVRGVVLRTDAKTRNVCEQIAAEGFPAVVVGDRFDNPTVSYVYCESRESSREAVQHLLDLGHQRIGLCINVVEDSDHADRLAGYRQALQSGGIEPDERLVFRVAARRESGMQVIRRIRAMPDRPTALYIADPMTAVGAMGEAQEMGLRVPQDLSIVGFDDSEVRFVVHPQMTAVCQDAVAMGREAFAALDQLIRGTGQTDSVRLALPTTFEVHGSTAAPSIGS